MANTGSGIRVGVDLGGTKIYAIVLDESLRVIGSARNPSNGHLGATKGMEAVIETIRTALGSAGVAKGGVRSMGIGCPGVVDLKNGVLRVAPNLGWRDVPVRDLLKKAFKCPVRVLNDVDAGTYAEYRFGAGKGAYSLLGAFPGTGLGGGFVLDGKILTGTRFTCMELGDLRIAGTSLLRPADEWPTLEDLSSRLAITSAVALEAYRGKAASLVDLPFSKIKSKTLEKSIALGEASTRAVLDKAIHYLGYGIASAVSLLGPDKIVLGGGLVERFPALYVSGVTMCLKRYVTEDLAAGITVSAATLGDDASAMGAAAYDV